MLAVIKTGGKQYLVKKGDKIKIEKIVGEAGDRIEFSEVLFLGDEKEVKIDRQDDQTRAFSGGCSNSQ